MTVLATQVWMEQPEAEDLAEADSQWRIFSASSETFLAVTLAAALAVSAALEAVEEARGFREAAI